MKRKAKTDYSMLIIMLPFCLMIELGKLVFQILNIIFSVRIPKQHKTPKHEPIRETKPKIEKPKELKPYQIEKYLSEIHKAKANISYLNEQKKNLLKQLEQFDNKQSFSPEQKITINGKEIDFEYSNEQIELYNSICDSEPNPKQEKEKQKIQDKIHQIEMKIITEKSKLKQYRIRLEMGY